MRMKPMITWRTDLVCKGRTHALATSMVSLELAWRRTEMPLF